MGPSILCRITCSYIMSIIITLSDTMVNYVKSCENCRDKTYLCPRTEMYFSQTEIKFRLLCLRELKTLENYYNSKTVDFLGHKNVSRRTRHDRANEF